MDDTQPARTVNRAPTTIPEAVFTSGGGMIPESGTFTATAWATLIGVSPHTIHEWVARHNIPYRAASQRSDIFIEAADFLNHIPKFGEKSATKKVTKKITKKE